MRDHVGLGRPPDPQVRAADELERVVEPEVLQDPPRGLLVLARRHGHPETVTGQARQQAVHSLVDRVLEPPHVGVALAVRAHRPLQIVAPEPQRGEGVRHGWARDGADVT